MAIDKETFRLAKEALYNIVCEEETAGSIGNSCKDSFDWGTELYMVRSNFITKTITNGVMSITIADDAKVYGIVISDDNDRYNSFKIQSTISNINNKANNAFQITLTNINLTPKAQSNLTRLASFSDYVFFVYQINANGDETMFVVGASRGGAIQSVINDGGNPNDTYGGAITLSGNSVIPFTKVADASAELLLEKLVDEDGEYVVVAP